MFSLFFLRWRKNLFHHFYQQARVAVVKKGKQQDDFQKGTLLPRHLLPQEKKQAVKMLIWRVEKGITWREVVVSVIRLKYLIIKNELFFSRFVIEKFSLTSPTSSDKSQIIEFCNLILHNCRTVSQLRAIIFIVTSSNCHHCAVVNVT